MYARRQSHACACLVCSINKVLICYQELESLLKQLSFVPGFAFTKDVSYIGFLDRVHEEDTKQSSTEHEDVLHPWLNLFLPKSRIRDLESAVFKWDDKMSAPIPDEEEVFYTIGLLPSATREDWEYFDKQHHEILSFCHQEGIEFKQYLPQYVTEMDWMKHFGRKRDSILRVIC
ncbi:hypothetical protein GW17_00007345 [Ensete ventricosum]|nr:hypothetical protein GW17_00007345 [Ensete ventricosum]